MGLTINVLCIQLVGLISCKTVDVGAAMAMGISGYRLRDLRGDWLVKNYPFLFKYRMLKRSLKGLVWGEMTLCDIWTNYYLCFFFLHSYCIVCMPTNMKYRIIFLQVTSYYLYTKCKSQNEFFFTKPFDSTYIKQQTIKERLPPISSGTLVLRYKI